ncbi:MAG: PrsW family glutamic-type intramembrane protease [Burkholderiales bacterium]
MKPEMIAPAVVSLLPVITFLAVLLWLDSYKLVGLRMVLAVLACGAAVAVAGYEVNALLITLTRLDLPTYSRVVAPVVEEMLKAAVIVVLIRTHRIGFLVDAAICGFAVGTGFAMVENLYYLHAIPDAGMGTWIVRGFGTAFMHGGVTALFAILGLSMLERARTPSLLDLLPGLLFAAALHAAYNYLAHWPRIAALTELVVLAPLLAFAFRHSEKAVGDWLGRGFDADAELLALIESGELSSSPVGQYLATLTGRFHGPVVADLINYLRLTCELALRAKGVLMMRENGFAVPPDEEVTAKFAELRYLEDSIGRTGLLALRPIRHFSRQDLWQLNMLQQ